MPEIITNAKGLIKKVVPGFFEQKVFPDRKLITPDQEVDKRTLDNMIKTQALRRESDPSQNEATVNIRTNHKWLGIFNTGDWHLGSERTDYQKWDHDMGLVRNTDGLYMNIVGDERDNFIIPKFASGQFEALANPQQQADMVEHVLTDMDSSGKLLARTGGNHDGWTWDQSGQSLEHTWYKKMKSPLLSNGGFVHILVDNIFKKLTVKYDFYLHHGKSIFNSNFNPNHATKRAYEFQGRYDAAAMGHTHVAEIAHGYRNNDSQQHDYVQMRTGTYKMDDQYARAKQLGRGQPAGSTVLINTECKRMMPFLKLEDAVEVLKALNKE
jgi:hypothetical protein